MFFFGKISSAKENAAKAVAISKSHAVVELRLDGTVITANENSLKTFGYTLTEIQGKHHGMFVEASERSSPAYREFWIKLNRGEPQSAEYKRVGKDGKEIWVQASYNPILDPKGKPTKVIEARHRYHREKDREPWRMRVRLPPSRRCAGGGRLQPGRHDPHGEPEFPQRTGLRSCPNAGPA